MIQKNSGREIYVILGMKTDVWTPKKTIQNETKVATEKIFK